ncbi:quercetin 2,3-dioxygenase [Streptomyces sp. NBC_00588]|jgi:quercetin dioxygenase-like cupin family protein|uniref:quercetin 2,3-dioxygenase n=1 Tax=Streptomyces sp. NBC_00588 TaxID=2975784 RepID=UPI002E81EE75|nr:quercetin 2,3-dioxygenase [Streptomyces sp. NBC_00588]WUB40833.1 quercetin 2,3-dioxygenase [Streptomyces sp. NBC_00588]
MTETAQPATSPFVAGPQDGLALWYLDVLKLVKAPAARTGGQMSVAEEVLPEGSSPPLHVHRREDEALYLLEGRLTCQVDDQVLAASAGSFVWLPRNIPHTFRVDSPTARVLVLCVPGGFEAFFSDIGRPAARHTPPPASEEPPDLAAMARHARTYGVELLGPPMA